jgi:hypothetical protein
MKHPQPGQTRLNASVTPRCSLTQMTPLRTKVTSTDVNQSRSSARVGSRSLPRGAMPYSAPGLRSARMNMPIRNTMLAANGEIAAARANRRQRGTAMLTTRSATLRRSPSIRMPRPSMLALIVLEYAETPWTAGVAANGRKPPKAADRLGTSVQAVSASSEKSFVSRSSSDSFDRNT